MSADNGPKVVPAPPGPTPTGAYEYLLLPRPAPVLPNQPFYMAFTSYQRVEAEMKMRSVFADRITLSNGDRVYRVLNQYMWRLDHDANGCFIGRSPLEVFRFVLNDPSAGQATMDDWEPVG